MRPTILALLGLAASATAACGDTPMARAHVANVPPAPRTLADAADDFLEHEDVTIRYRVLGDGPPVVLLHGYTDRVEMWGATADSLARDHRVIIPDLRGFGRSSAPADSTRYGHAMVDDVVALLDRLAVPQAHVVGYSMGALLAANLALDHPTRVRSATLLAGPFWEDSLASAREMAPYIADLRTDAGLAPFFRMILPTWPDSVLLPVAEQLLADNDRRVLVASASSFPSLTLDWSRVRASAVPATIVVGTADPLVPHSRRIAARWPGARLVEVPRGDHADIWLLPRTLDATRATIAAADGAPHRDGAPTTAARR